MTIGRRLIVLVGVPLVALLVFGVFARLRLAEIEERNRFVAETQLGSVAALASITAGFAELRVSVRNSLLAGDASERPRVPHLISRTSRSRSCSSNTAPRSSATRATASCLARSRR